MTVDITSLKRQNASRFAKAKIIRSGFEPVAKRLVATKSRYQTVETKTGVPWAFIAVAHERESSQNFNTQLGQGDPLDQVSVHVPAGRGPFKTWEDSAVDALVNCSPFAARNRDWSIGGTLTMLEEYNGLGYAARGLPSPYVWSGTDQYRTGKFVRDGVFDPSAIDQQLGCAGLLISMMALDPSIKFTSVGSQVSNPAPKPSPPTITTPKPSITHPADGSIGSSIASAISAIIALFKRK